jgi:hypothetical protein
VADINAIKPLGVEGLAPNDDGKELKPSVYGIGALAIGKLKIKTETEMIKRATAEPSGLFDYAIATHRKDRFKNSQAACQIASSFCFSQIPFFNLITIFNHMIIFHV